MVEAAQHIIPIITPVREYEDHEGHLRGLAVFPYGRRMVTGSWDKTLRLWDLKDGTVLKKMKGHRHAVSSVAISPNGQLVASGDGGGELISWHGDTGESLTQAIGAHSTNINS